MKIKMVLLAALVAASVSLPGTASAKIVYAWWSCNSDGYVHVEIGFSDGKVMRRATDRLCGPIAFGGGFNLLLSDETRVSQGGQAFMDGLEAGEAISFTRVQDRDAIVTKDVDNMETIYLRSDDVGPRLAAFFVQIDRDWNAKPESPLTGGTIFDRWGRNVSAVVLVPGDMGITILLPAGEGGSRTNAGRSCRDRSGFWRQGSAREWGCWTTPR